MPADGSLTWNSSLHAPPAIGTKGGPQMLSANFAVDTVSPFPGVVSPKVHFLPLRSNARAGHALSLVEAGTYGNRMAKHLHLANAPMISVKTRHRAQLAVTRLRSETALADRTTPFPCERAFTVQLHLRPVSPVKLWLHGRPVPVETAQEDGSVSILPLEQDPSMYLGSAFDMVQFYVSRAALDEFADENDGCRCETLSWPFGKVDSRLKNLALCLLPVLERPEVASELYVDHLVFAAHAYIARTYGGITTCTIGCAWRLGPMATEPRHGNAESKSGWADCALPGGTRMQTICQSFRARLQADRGRAALPLASAATHRRSQGTSAAFRPAHGRDCAQVRVCRSGMFHPGLSQVARDYARGVAADAHAVRLLYPPPPLSFRDNQSRLSTISPRNHDLRSVSSIQTSIRLVVATSLWRSHTS